MSVRWIGVDGGEQRHVVVVLDEEGGEEKRLQVQNSRRDLERCFLGLRGRYGSETLRVVCEGRRSFSYLVVQLALRCGLEVWQVSTTALEAYRKSEGQPRKSDSRDGYLLGRMGYLGLESCRELVAAKDEEQQLARLSRLRDRLVREGTRLGQQLRCRLLELCPELLSEESKGPGVLSQRMFAVLRRWPGLEGLERAHVKTIVGVLKYVSQEQKQQEAGFLREVAAGICMPAKEREVVTLELSYTLDLLDRVHAQQREVDEQLKRLVLAHPLGEKLLEAPGIGVYTAAVELGFVLPLARNSTEAQVATYAGATPLSRSSGKSQRSRLSRGSNKQVLHARFQSALAATKVSSLDRAYYEKKRRDYQGHPAAHVKAVLALVRQRSKMIYKLLTTDERYDREVLIRSHLERRAA